MGISLTPALNPELNHGQNPRLIILNADDLGLSPAVNAGILRLAQLRRVTATSYMVGGNIDKITLNELKNCGTDIGLHLDFTGIFTSPLTRPLKHLLLGSYTHQLDKKTLEKAIHQQFDEFETTIGITPVFVDGHQHIHQFPMIRQVLLETLTQRYQGKVMTRNTQPILPDKKAWIIYQLGGRAWQRQCLQQGIKTNTGFGGVYDFNAEESQLAKLWETWLAHCPIATTQNPNVTLIMCHPALPDDTWQEEIKTAREVEYHWLLSEKFAELCQQYQVKFCHWRDLA